MKASQIGIIAGCLIAATALILNQTVLKDAAIVLWGVAVCALVLGPAIASAIARLWASFLASRDHKGH